MLCTLHDSAKLLRIPIIEIYFQPQISELSYRSVMNNYKGLNKNGKRLTGLSPAR